MTDAHQNAAEISADAATGTASWRRRRDPRGRNVPSSVTAVIRYAYNGLVRAHMAEALCFGIGIGLVTIASALFSGAERGLELGGLGFGLGLVGGSAWLIGSRTSMESMTRRLDRKLRFEGALVTALEVETAQAEGPIAALLSERVRERLRRGEALRTVLPPIAPPLAAILLGVAACFGVLEREEVILADVDVAGLMQGARSRLVQARSDALDALEAGELEPEEAQSLIDAVEELDDWTPDAGASQLEKLDRKLAAQELQSNLSPALSLELERARAQIDAVRAELERQDQPNDEENGGPGAGPADAGLTNSDQDGMMAGSSASAEQPAGDPGDPGEGHQPPQSIVQRDSLIEERATFTAWWPTEYNGVVRAWVNRPR